MINGYDKVEWGTSFEDVNSIYGKLEDLTTDENKKKGVLHYGISYKEGIMSKRYFYFYNKKLYSVKVVFYDLDTATEDLLFKKFKEKYGKPSDPKKYSYPLNDTSFSKGFEMFCDISDELTVSISIENLIEKDTNTILVHANIYEYYNPKVVEEIDLANAKKNIDAIEV